MPDPRSNIETPLFYDAFRIVDPNSPEAQRFAGRMDGIMRQLLGENFKPAEHSYRYLLSDSPEFNGFTVPSAKPPVVVIYKGVIESAKSLDAIAAVLGHERGHNLAEKKLGQHNNTKLEELGSDGLSIKMLYDGGFNPRTVEELDIHQTGSASDNPWADAAQALSDVHPLAINRVTKAKQTRAALERLGFIEESERPYTPVPEALLADVRAATHHSQTNIAARAFAAGYDTMAMPDKLTWLAQEANRVGAITHDQAPFAGEARQAYGREIMGMFEKLGPIHIPELQPLYETTLSRLMGSGMFDVDVKNPSTGKYERYANPHATEHLYRTAMQGLGLSEQQGKLPILGDFRGFSDAVQGYVAAQNPQEALHYATTINEFYDRYKSCFSADRNGNSLFKHLALPSLQLPDIATVQAMLAKGEAVHSPLLNHENWAYSPDPSTVNWQQNAGEALLRANNILLGGPDILWGAYLSSIPDLGRGNYYYPLHEHYYNGAFAEAASITAVNPVHAALYHGDAAYKSLSSEALLKAETAYLQTRRAHEVAVLEHGVDWSRLFTDRERFFAEYKPYLTPELTLQSYDHPFAHALTEYLDKTARENPELLNKADSSDPLRRSAKERIFDRLLPEGYYNGLQSPEANAVNTPKFLKRAGMHLVIAGLDVDHPYVQEAMKLDHRRYSNRLVDYMRVDPVHPSPEFVHMFGDATTSSQFSLAGQALRLRESEASLRMLEQGISPQRLVEAQQAVNKMLQLHPASENPSPYEMQYQEHVNGMAAKIAEHRQELIAGIQNLGTRELFDTYGRIDGTHDPELKNQWAEAAITRLSSHQDFQNLYDSVKGVWFGTNKLYPPTPESSQVFMKKIAADIERYSDYGRQQDNLFKVLDFHAAKIPFPLLNQVVQDLAHKWAAQPELAYQMRDYLENKATRSAQGEDRLVHFGEAALSVIKSRPEMRVDLLEFFSNPAENASPELMERLRPTAVWSTMAPGKDIPMHQDFLRKLHQDLWHAPLPARMALLNEILFPAGVDAQTATHITNRLIDRMVDGRAAPFTLADIDPLHVTTEAPNPSESVEARTAKLIIKSYLDTVAAHEPVEAQMLVSALFSADNERAPGTKMRMGQVLKLVLSNMGPAGGAMMQAIHSNPSTPTDIQKDLDDSKGNHDKPAQWDAAKMAEQAGLLDPAKTGEIGQVVGGGKYGITMENYGPDGTRYADTFLRPRARAQMVRELDFMQQTAEIIGQADPSLKPVAGMIHQAKKYAYIETRMDLAAKQNAIIQQSLGGVQVTYTDPNGRAHVFTHQITPLVEHGEGYKRALFAPGKSYDYVSEDMSSYARRGFGYAMLGPQLSLMTAGLPLELDQHKGNIKVDGEVDKRTLDIHHYDFGMTDLVLPTNEQKMALGKVFAKAVKATKEAMDAVKNSPESSYDTRQKNLFAEKFIEQINLANASPEGAAMLSNVRTGMLALGDYFKHPVPVSQLNDHHRVLTGLLGEAIYGEHVDPVFQKAFVKELGPITAPWVKKYFNAAMAESPVRIANIPASANIVMPELAPEDLAIIRNYLAPETSAQNHANIPPTEPPAPMPDGHNPAPYGRFGRGLTTGLSLSGLVGTMKQYKENGGGAAYGISVTAAGVSAADDLMAGRLFAKIPGIAGSPRFAAGVPLVVGFIPDMVNLSMAKTDDQRNSAASSLTTGAGTTLLLRGSSLAGPEVAVVVMAANYVGQRTIAPSLKIADGWIHNDNAKMDIGTLRLKAGGTELLYKTTTLSGATALTADVFGGAGGISKMSGELLNDGVDWVLGNSGETSKIMRDAGIYRSMTYAGNPMSNPYALGDLLSLAGDGLTWSETKLNQAADWISDKVGGMDKKLRDDMRGYSKDADALQAKYDEAHRKNLIPAERLELNAHIEAYSKATSALACIINKEGAVDAKALGRAQQAYEASYQALINDPMFKVKPTTLADHKQAMNIVYERPAVQDNTYRAPVSLAEKQARTEQYKQQQARIGAAEEELRQFIWNPVTDKFKAGIGEEHATIGKAVEAKRQQWLGQQAQGAYGKVADTYNALTKQLGAYAVDLQESAAKLSTLEQLLTTTNDAAERADAQAKLAQLKKHYEESAQKLTQFGESLEALTEQHVRTGRANSLYHTSKETQKLTGMLAEMKTSLEQLQQVLTPEKIEAMGQMAPVPASNEAALTKLIEQSPALADASLQEKVKQEAARLLAYYTKGLNANGQPVADADAKLRDGKLDAEEMKQAIAEINEKFKDQGVAISSSTYSAGARREDKGEAAVKI